MLAQQPLPTCEQQASSCLVAPQLCVQLAVCKRSEGGRWAQWALTAEGLTADACIALAAASRLQASRRQHSRATCKAGRHEAGTPQLLCMRRHSQQCLGPQPAFLSLCPSSMTKHCQGWRLSRGLSCLPIRNSNVVTST
jgi:hypothetical protein